MLDPVKIDAFRRVVDPIEHAMVPDPKAIAFFSRQLEAAGRARFPGKIANLFDDTSESRTFELVEVPSSRGQDEDLIHGGS